MAPKALQNAFEYLSDELISMIIYPILVHQEPIISVGYGNYPFPDAFSILQVSQRFHRIGEHILYRHNLFELWDPKRFLPELSPAARGAMQRLRIHWPQSSWSHPYMEVDFTMELMASCTGLDQLEIFSFFEDFPKSTRAQIRRRLPIRAICFESMRSTS